MRPLVVDLDGTLHSDDLSWLIFKDVLLSNPYRCFKALLLWVTQNKAAMKTDLALFSNVSVADLNWHRDVISYCVLEKTKGRMLVLATGTPQRIAESCNRHLGYLFDEVIGTDESVNLIGEAKRDHLVKRYRLNGYAYIGNSSQDLPVWSTAAEIGIAYANGKVKRGAEMLNRPIVVRFP